MCAGVQVYYAANSLHILDSLVVSIRLTNQGMNLFTRNVLESMPRFVSQAQRSVKLGERKGRFEIVHALQTMTSHKTSA